jgi:signal transduction histidine kinase
MPTSQRSMSLPPPDDSTPFSFDERRSEFSLSRIAVLLAVVVLVALWAAVAWVLSSQRESVLKAELRQNANLARTLQEQTERVFAAVDQATLRVAEGVASGTGQGDLVSLANETGLAPKILVQLSLVGADGLFLDSNIDPKARKAGPVDLSQREHVRVHLAPAAVPEAARRLPANGLFIGKPVLGKVSGKWTIQVSRRIVGAQGRTLGVVVASLDPGYFEAVYSRVALGQQGSVTLAGDDLNVRARVTGGKPQGMGLTIGPASPFASGPRGAEGDYRVASTLDGVDRQYAYRRIGQYPMYVLVATGIDEALAEWRSGRNAVLALALLSSLGVVAGTLGFVAGLRRLEGSHAALRQSEAQAQAANQAKTEFLAAISHELRTPLTSIRGFAELMEHRLPDARFREQAGLIRKGAEHLNTLLTEILDLSRVEAGAMPIVSEPTDLRKLVQDTAEFFTLSAVEKGLALNTRVAEDVPALTLCDALRVKQILNNLLSNAVKFTLVGEVRIDLEARHGRLLCHVLDTGPGIAPELQDKVFERFSQGSARVSYQHGGTGLGLALSRALAELMGGRLTLQSELGTGACFTLSLPLRPVLAQESAAELPALV